MDGLIPTERSGSGDEIRVEFHERVGPFGQSIPGVLGKLAPAGEPAKEFTPRALVTEGSSGLSPWSLFRAAPDFEMGLRSHRSMPIRSWRAGSSRLPSATGLPCSVRNCLRCRKAAQRYGTSRASSRRPGAASPIGFARAGRTDDRRPFEGREDQNPRRECGPRADYGPAGLGARPQRVAGRPVHSSSHARGRRASPRRDGSRFAALFVPPLPLRRHRLPRGADPAVPVRGRGLFPLRPLRHGPGPEP